MHSLTDLSISTRATRTLVAAIGLTLVLALAGCGGGAPVGDASSGANGGGSGTSEAALAPEFALQDMDGQSVSLADSTGRIRLIDFWATWCAPCRKEVPMFNELHAEYADKGLEILAISEFEDPPELVREFLETNEVKYPNLLGTEQVTRDYNVFGLPTTYLVDREGRIVKSYVGPKPRRVLEAKIRELLELPPA